MDASVGFEGLGGRDEARLERFDGFVVVSWGPRVLFRFDEADTGMRSLVMVSLADAGTAGKDVAALFGLSADYFSKMRVRVRRLGSAELVRPMGRPAKLSAGDVAKARRWAGKGVSGQTIASRLGVSGATVSRALAGAGVAVELTADPVDDSIVPDTSSETGSDTDTGVGSDDEAGRGGFVDDGAAGAGAARIVVGEVSCRYAGAMLLHSFFDVVGAGTVLGPLESGPARCYDSMSVALCAMFGLLLGTGSMEAVKHLGRADLGALAGIEAAPELRALRLRLGVMADGCDPQRLQTELTRGLIATAAPPEQVFFIDDHFVPYYGAQPVAKGWNTKRRHAQPGRDDTYICDLSGRALCFTSSEPSGLSVTMRNTVAELRRLCPDAPLTLGFDRGGSYPVAFTWLTEANVTWLSWRRGALVSTTAEARWSWFTLDGRRHTYRVIDETITLNGYGPARQITLIEADTAVAQVLTSDTVSTPARLVHLLKCRWRIENAFKYLTEHNGIDLLCDYRMDHIADERPVTNPERTTAKAVLAALKAELAATEGALGVTLTTNAPTPDKLTTIRRLRDQRTMIIDEINEANQNVRAHPAEIPANQRVADATRALPRLGRRSLQLVLRLLAYNAEHWLAEHLNAYLADPDEIRATTRHLLQQPGTINYTTHQITVTINTPDQPRIARALHHLTQELNTTPAHIPGDHRPITYQIGP